MKTNNQAFSRAERFNAAIKRQMLRLRAGFLSDFGSDTAACYAWKDVWVHELVYLKLDDPRRADALINCASHYIEFRDKVSLDAALGLLGKAAALVKDQTSYFWISEQGRVLWYTGRAYARLGQAAKALQCHLDAEKVFVKMDSPSQSRFHNLQDMSGAYSALGMPLMAQDARERAEACWAVLAAAHTRHPTMYGR